MHFFLFAVKTFNGMPWLLFVVPSSSGWALTRDCESRCTSSNMIDSNVCAPHGYVGEEKLIFVRFKHLTRVKINGFFKVTLLQMSF